MVEFFCMQIIKNKGLSREWESLVGVYVSLSLFVGIPFLGDW